MANLVIEPRRGEKLIIGAPDGARDRVVETDVKVLDRLDRAADFGRDDRQQLRGVPRVGALLLVGLEMRVSWGDLGFCKAWDVGVSGLASRLLAWQ